MKAYALKEQFGLDNLDLVDRPSPTPGHGQVKLKMRAVSLNYRDVLMVLGAYNPDQPLPLVPCSDGVGEVVQVGEGVDDRLLGRRVIPIFAQGWRSGEPTKQKLNTALGGPLDGTLAEEMVVPADSVVEAPDHLTDPEAATLTCAGVTAWNALFEQGDLGAGDNLLTLGTGGVSTFAAQFGQLAGARVIVTSSSDDKLERMLDAAADDGINYREDDQWEETVRQLTDGRGADLVVEVGGAGTLQKSIRAVRIGGQISLIGVLAGRQQPLDIVPVLMQNIRIQGVVVGHREMFERMNRAISHHRMRPLVDRVFSFDEANQAFEAMGDDDRMGKICIRLE